MRRGELVEHINVKHSGGSYRRPCMATAIPGLVLVFFGESFPQTGWSITHAKSGLNISDGFYPLDEALRRLAKLKGSGDWTRSKAAILKDPVACAAARSIRRAS